MFKVGKKVQWKWMGRAIMGVVKEFHCQSIEREIKGKKIKRNGTPDNPAYLVESEAGNLALKLGSELQSPTKPGVRGQKKRLTPTLFGED
jgi:hypothetical protein